MEWWNNFVTWLSSDEGWQLISTAVLPFVAILVAGILAAAIARGSVKRLLAHQQGESKAAAIATLIRAGRKSVTWSALPAEEQRRQDDLITEAEIRVRLLPIPGVASAADWAAHQLASMKKNSASFSFQAEQTFVDYRDRLLEWQDKPKRARKLFAYDLEKWRYEDADVALGEKQHEWAASQPAEAQFNEDDFEDAGATAPVPPATRLATPVAPALPPVQTPQTAVFPESIETYSPPVTAGTVRQRLAPETRDTL